MLASNNMHACYLITGYQLSITMVSGINQWEGDSPPKYTCNTSLSSRVSFLNPAWNEDSSEGKQFEKFMEAVKLTGSEFEVAVNYVGKVFEAS